MKLTGWHIAYGSTSCSETVDFGVRDAKGRAVGGYATVGVNGGRAGEWCVQTWSTRDSNGFGAIPRGTIVCGTKEQAMALAEQKLDAARKRQVKQFGSTRAVAS